MRYLLVENDASFAESLCKTFERVHLSVDWAVDDCCALTKLGENAYDGLIIDMMPPGLAGLSLISQLRTQGLSMPILCTSGSVGRTILNIALDAGADDYIEKPFDVALLLAKMRALCRIWTPCASGFIVVDTLTLDPSNHIVTLAGQEISLRAKEFEILHIFMQNPGKLMPVTKIMEGLRNSSRTPHGNSFAVHICNLRRKLKGRLIENVRGQGFRLSA